MAGGNPGRGCSNAEGGRGGKLGNIKSDMSEQWKKSCQRHEGGKERGQWMVKGQAMNGIRTGLIYHTGGQADT